MQTKTIFKKTIAAVVVCFAITHTACQKENAVTTPQADVLTAVGDSISIAPVLAQFRSLLGDSLNTAPGKVGGRREINWDAVPASFQDNNTFPSDFFAQTDAVLPNGRKRGAIFTTTLANDLRISSKSFDDVYAGFGSQFKVFSPKLVFGTMNGNVIDVSFKVPGQATDATVKGFGVIFLDVDKANKTSLEFFDAEGNSLGKFFAKPNDSKFSFLGVKFKDNIVVSKVRITSGEEGIANIASYNDKVGMDDFLYDEPVAK
jgi:hypothetical protein